MRRQTDRRGSSRPIPAAWADADEADGDRVVPEVDQVQREEKADEAVAECAQARAPRSGD
jgi:hypothetical protein